MATGGSGQNISTCAICLGEYRDPRFLPCHHTFCASCIQNLADHHPGGRFPCPACRKTTSLSPGGVASLQKNYYIQEKPSRQNACKTHHGKKLEFYCKKCDTALCINCKLTCHELHETEDLNTAVSEKRTELQSQKQRLQRAVSDVTKTMTSLQIGRQDRKRERAAVERKIRERHAVIVTAADKKRDQLLRSLQSADKDLDRRFSRRTAEHGGHTAKLTDLIRQVDNALTSGSGSDVITVAKEMRSGVGSESVLDTLTSVTPTHVLPSRLQYNFKTDVDVETAINDYLGDVPTQACVVM